MTSYDLELLSDDEIRGEIIRLRRELDRLKSVIAERSHDNEDLKKEFVKTQEALNVIFHSVENISGSIEEIENSLSSMGRELQEFVHEEVEDVIKKYDAKFEMLGTCMQGYDYSPDFKRLDAEIAEIDQSINSKLGDTGIRTIRKKLEVLSAFVVVNAVGSLISIGILLYFILVIL